MKENLALIGFSGTGKSAVGREVARGLGWRFIDADEEIAAHAGKSIADIFAQEGEARFRELERQEVRKACAGDMGVVSVGGGAVTDADSYAVLTERAVMVCLEARPETIYRRLRGATGNGASPEVRPLLAGPDPLGRIRSLKAQRQPCYALADWTVHTDGLTIGQVAAEVLRGWRVVRQQPPGGPPGSGGYPLPQDVACVVHTSSGSYPVYVGWGLGERMGALLKGVGVGGTIYLFTDENALRPHGRRIQVVLHEAGLVVHLFVLPPGETTKSLETAQVLYQWLAERHAERGHTILAVGGGVVGDLAGYVAATFLRGLPLVQVPTTLAAMVDASIGGKTAVNLPQAKNLVGAFHQPRAVIADVAVLSTLPPRELASGWAEAIKHALILDPDLLGLFEREAEALLALDPEVTTRVVRRSAAIKAGVVTEDEGETTGRRSILNYGHTVGHAIEAATEYGAYLHGEAVSVGMVGAAEVGQRLGVTPPEVARRQRGVLACFRLPLTCPGVDPEAVLQAMALDKKVAGGSLRWVLLEEVGRTVLRQDVPLPLVREVVAELCRGEG